MNPIRELDEQGVQLLTLDRPERKNAFDEAQWDGLANALNEAREDPRVAVVVLTGAGGNFSSGGGSGGGFAQTAASFIGAGPVSLALSAIFAIVGGAHIWKAISRKYRDHIKASPMVGKWIDLAAIGGLCSRGVIFLIIAFLLLRHGLQGNGGRAGLGDALDFIAGLPFGVWLLGATGAGFFLFSVYSFAEAIWRRINVENA